MMPTARDKRQRALLLYKSWRAHDSVVLRRFCEAPMPPCRRYAYAYLRHAAVFSLITPCLILRHVFAMLR